MSASLIGRSVECNFMPFMAAIRFKRARFLIEDEQNWCRSELARDDDGTSVCPTDSRAKRRCALGAFIAAAFEITTDFSLPTILLLALFDCLALDLPSHVQNVLAASEVDVSRREVAQAFVVALVIVVVDEGGDGLFQLAGQIVVFEKYPAFQ